MSGLGTATNHDGKLITMTEFDSRDYKIRYTWMD